MIILENANRYPPLRRPFSWCSRELGIFMHVRHTLWRSAWTALDRRSWLVAYFDMYIEYTSSLEIRNAASKYVHVCVICELKRFFPSYEDPRLRRLSRT